MTPRNSRSEHPLHQQPLQQQSQQQQLDSQSSGGQRPPAQQQTLPVQAGGRVGGEAAFTLLEIIVVIGIVAFIYAVALPNFTFQSSSEVANRLGRLSQDIRAAYDLSVLRGRPHRLVFQLSTGDYWLEGTDAKQITLGDRLAASDPSEQQEQEKAAEFEEAFTKYEDLAGDTFRDAETEEPIPTVTPVLRAKDALKGPSWYKVDSLEWQKRSLGTYLLLKDIQAEHHERPITMEDQGREAVAMVYFLPQGYAEKATLHIYYRKGENEIDTEREPYTVVIDPYQGTADVRSGLEEVNVHEEERS